VPPGATLVFSAHGVSQAVRREATARGFSVFDATCPLVTKVHVEVAKLHKEGYDFIMIGHKGHPEVEGTMGQLTDGIYLVEDVADVDGVQPRGDRLAVVTQTTLSVDDAAEILAAVKRRFTAERICAASSTDSVVCVTTASLSACATCSASTSATSSTR
jgi:4-hydroxy-3-methylbut-2-enyl diphosphate reductase